MIVWRLRELMARKKVTNRELAKDLGRHETSISRLKSGDRMPQIDGEMLEEICKALDCTPNDLIEYIPDQSVEQG